VVDAPPHDLEPGACQLPARTKGRGSARALSCALLVCGLLVGLWTEPAAAHPLSTTAVLLDVERQTVTAQVQMPVDRLAVALDQPLTAASVLQPATLSTVRDYVHGHLSASDEAGRAWTTTIGASRVEVIDGVDHLVLEAALVPADGTVGDFTLHYDAILDRIVSHRIFVSARQGETGNYTSLGMLSWQRQSVPVPAAGPTATSGFLASLQLGVEHIRTGADHLLFLLMLLLPAPVLAQARRWVPRDDPGRASWRVVHVVTAFAVGHSLTLALGAVGLVHLPTRLVEAGIALSVLVAAVHATRPLVRRGEVLIAGTFGLLHGLAFAALVDQQGLGRGSIVVDLLGFNVGIEIAQLLVVVLVMPSLWVLSRTGAYAAIRTTAAGAGVVFAAAWLMERTGLLSDNPLEPASDLVVGSPLLLPAALALAAGLAWSLLGLRRQEVGPPSPTTQHHGLNEPASTQTASA